MLNLKKILEKYHKVYIISRKSEIRDKNIYTINLPSTNFFINQIYKLIVVLFSLYLLLKKKIDFFVTREYFYIIALYPFTRFSKARLIYDMHCFRYKELSVEGRSLKAFIIKPFELLCHRLADSIITVSKGIYDDLSPKLRQKAYILSNGVNLNEFKGQEITKSLIRKYEIPGNKKIVGFVGNWMAWVDIPTLLESSNYFDKDTILLVLGRGYEPINLKKLSKQYPNAVFTGRIPHEEVLQLLQIMDVCVLPYKKEEVIKHLSIRKTLEYLAAGKPIIMSDSDIGEKKFLTENKNVVLYEPGNPVDLDKKVKSLLTNKSLMNSLAKNNLKLAQNFTWEKQIIGSNILRLLRTYDYYKKIKLPQEKITIVIKALNEEQHIADSVQSAISALEGMDKEIILVDSLSDDNTVKIAKKYPVKIVQIKNKKQRCCGIGPQTGYMLSKGDYIYILDGDMVLDKNFIKKALPYFNDKTVAGVGGNILEKSADNLAFQVRTKSHIVDAVTEVDQLGMGGLYRREVLERVGYFSNPYFYAYEEYDLGAEIQKLGYKLLRIPEEMIEHFGDETPAYITIYNRMKSRYLFGSGQYLRRSLIRGHFLKTIWELRIYIFTLLWASLGILSFVTLPLTSQYFRIYLNISLLFIIVLLLRKRNLYRLFFSIISWSSQAIGMMIGFFLPQKEPSRYRPKIEIIKNG